MTYNEGTAVKSTSNYPTISAAILPPQTFFAFLTVLLTTRLAQSVKTSYDLYY